MVGWVEPASPTIGFLRALVGLAALDPPYFAPWGVPAEQCPPTAWCIETDVAMPLKKISPRERLGRPRRLGSPTRTQESAQPPPRAPPDQAGELRGVPGKGPGRVRRSQGAMLATCSMLSLHTAFGERLFRERKFDLRGARRILDVGSGAGQLAKHVLKYADPEQPADLLRSVAGNAPPGPQPPAERPAASSSWPT